MAAPRGLVSYLAPSSSTLTTNLTATIAALDESLVRLGTLLSAIDFPLEARFAARSYWRGDVELRWPCMFEKKTPAPISREDWR
jgi:hypothetical protein